jgi:uncharacterized protein YyaL (SSP411 family)
MNRAQATLERYGPGLAQVVRVMPMMAANLALWHARRTEVVLAGSPDQAGLQELERIVASRYLPWSVVAPLDPDHLTSSAASGRMPWLGAMTLKDGRATAYVCQDFSCQTPTGDPDELSTQLDNAMAARRILA